MCQCSRAALAPSFFARGGGQERQSFLRILMAGVRVQNPCTVVTPESMRITVQGRLGQQKNDRPTYRSESKKLAVQEGFVPQSFVLCAGIYSVVGFVLNANSSQPTVIQVVPYREPTFPNCRFRGMGGWLVGWG